MPDAHLIVFSRAPVAGATKTRLIPALGAEGARDFHAACLLDLLDEVAAWRADRARRGLGRVTLHACVWPPGSGGDFARAGVAWPPGTRLRDQQGADLGARMERALAEALAEAPGAALLVGTDLPLLRARHLEAALAHLAEADVVFGPSLDGGYHLVGLRRPQPGLFALPAWGGADVLARSLAAARRLGLRTACGDPLPDADVPADLPRVLAHPLAGEPAAGGRALRLLRARLGGG
jgi:hypothetical protein